MSDNNDPADAYIVPRLAEEGLKEVWKKAKPWLDEQFGKVSNALQGNIGSSTPPKTEELPPSRAPASSKEGRGGR
jgi:hypothetical protein